ALAERTFAREARAQRVGAQVHCEIHVAPGARHEPDTDDVGVIELGGRLGLVAKPDLERGVGPVAGLQDLDRYRRAVELAADEHPGESALAEQALELVGADGAADQVGGRGVHGGFTSRRWASKLMRSQ